MDLNGEPRTASWPLAQGVLLFGLLAFGMALRLFCAERPFWIDEAWVLNLLRTASLADMFDYRDWAQTTPPGLLLLLRGVTQALPQAVSELRWLFVLCGVVTLLLFVRLASSFHGRGFLCLACATFAFSPDIVWNATEFKQYGVDALVMIVSLLCGAAYIQRPTRQAYTRWCAVNPVCLPRSFSAVFTLPALGLKHSAHALLWRCHARTRQYYVDGLGMAAALAMTVYMATALNFLGPWSELSCRHRGCS